jgi:catechol 2,3-dioxygenase-like lactoylglutathione lyase family enzyme
MTSPKGKSKLSRSSRKPKPKRGSTSRVAVNEVLACATLVVREYDEAIEYFTRALGFDLVEDTPLPGGHRWVLVAPEGSPSLRLLLARAATPAQEDAVGKQTGGRVSFFLHTSDFHRAYERMRERGVTFLEAPRAEPYGTVAVFADLYGNRWDLIEPRQGASSSEGRRRPTTETGIAIPILPSRDLTETRAFYARLGFTAAGWWPTEFGGYAILVRGDLTMHFFAYPELSPKENYGQCYWRVTDPDGLHSEFSGAGLDSWPDARVTPIEDKPWGTREFALVDPSGNLVRIGTPKV